MSIILVTGSSTGIGQETALHMARKGHKVYASLRNPDGADEIRQKIAAENLDVEVIRLDLTDAESIDNAVGTILDKNGRIDVLVNNAGIGGGCAVEETSMDTVRDIFETNYFGNVQVMRAVIPSMRKQCSGSIVTVTSLAGRAPMGCHAHYSASKFAMEGLSECLAQELAEFNIRVALVEPGCVLTPIWEKGAFPEQSHYGKSLARLGRFFEFGLRRPAMPSDVAIAIAHAIESDEPHFRYPVGPDATELTAARGKISDDEWMQIHCLPDEEFFNRMAELVGIDYYRD